jgi:hypothetical protein
MPTSFRVLHRLALPVVEVGRHGDHRPGDGHPEVVGGHVADLVRDASSDLLEVELAASDVDDHVVPVAGADLVTHGLAHRLDDLARPAPADEPLAAVHGVLGLSCHWRFASWPMSSFPFSSMANTEGTV